nr:hypothetical protein [Tanacetum cinerariifolium]
MASDQLSSDPVPKCQTMALNHNSLIRCLTNLLNGSSKVVSKSFAVSAADAPNQRQQYTTPLNIHTTPAPTCQVQSLAPTVISSENINQAESHAKNDKVADDEFINIFSTPVQDQGEMSSRHVDSSNMHTFYQRYPSEHLFAAAPSKSKPVLTTAARTISAVKPKFYKTCPNIAPYDVSKSKSPLRRPFIKHLSPKPSISPPRVNAVKLSAVSAAQHNHGKKVWKPKCPVL